jgi:hypothetical protein
MYYAQISPFPVFHGQLEELILAVLQDEFPSMYHSSEHLGWAD